MVGWRSNGCVLWLFFGCVVFFFGWCVATCVVVRAGMTNAPVTSCICSLYRMRASETCKFFHPSCMKTCNAFALLVFMQLGCMQYEINEFLREHVQRKSVARKRAALLRCTCTNLHGACTELARKLEKFCTNLHTLVFLAFKLKRSTPTPQQVATAYRTQHWMHNKKMALSPRRCSSALPPRLATTFTSASAPKIRDDRAEVPGRASA